MHQALALAAEQSGALALWQLRGLGISRSTVDAAVRARRWRRVLPGVLVTFTGPLPDLTKVWCAVLYCGPGAVASHRTALWLHDGAGPALPSVVDVSVPHRCQVASRPGITVARRRDLADVTAVAGAPPRTRLDATVLDLAQRATGEEAAIDPVLRAIQRRLTTASRLRSELARRARHRWRGLLTEVLAETEDGVTTHLERRYVRDVERAHGLPRGRRNRPERTSRGNRYRDNRYVDYGLLVELDGQEAHPPENAHQDRARDNAATVNRQGTLRYGWRDVTGGCCRTAGEVGAALRYRGWAGNPHACGPACGLSTGDWVDLRAL